MYWTNPFSMRLFLAFLLGSQISYAQNTHSLAPDVFEKQITQSHVQILDVRTASEYQSGHISQSLLADWTDQQQFKERIAYLDKSLPVYVYCLSGGRSGSAAQWMRENGFSAVFELKGGINAWKMASLPLEGKIEVKQLTLQDYRVQIGHSGLVLVDFGAEWCPPCKKMEPVLLQLQKEWAGKFRLLAIDAGAQIQILKELDIEKIPTFIEYRDGQEIWRRQGLIDLDSFRQGFSGK
jgi:rhodanese-related sulfurtransferase